MLSLYFAVMRLYRYLLKCNRRRLHPDAGIYSRNKRPRVACGNRIHPFISLSTTCPCFASITFRSNRRPFIKARYEPQVSGGSCIGNVRMHSPPTENKSTPHNDQHCVACTVFRLSRMTFFSAPDFEQNGHSQNQSQRMMYGSRCEATWRSNPALLQYMSLHREKQYIRCNLVAVNNQGKSLDLQH